MLCQVLMKNTAAKTLTSTLPSIISCFALVRFLCRPHRFLFSRPRVCFIIYNSQSSAERPRLHERLPGEQQEHYLSDPFRNQNSRLWVPNYRGLLRNPVRGSFVVTVGAWCPSPTPHTAILPPPPPQSLLLFLSAAALAGSGMNKTKCLRWSGSVIHWPVGPRQSARLKG